MQHPLFQRRANLALGFTGMMLGLVFAVAGALSQSSGAAVGQSLGVLGAMTGLTAAALGIAWSRSKRQA